jgi:hypothetical protein
MRSRPGALLANSHFAVARLSSSEILRRRIIACENEIEFLESKLKPIEANDQLVRQKNLKTLMEGMRLGELPNRVIAIVLTYDVVSFGNQSPAVFRLYAQIAPRVVELDDLKEHRKMNVVRHVR